MLDNPRAVAGHNNPPPSPLEAAEARIKSLHDEISFWLDGDPIPNQEVADDITNRLAEVREAVKEADAARKAEKQPHDDAAKAVEAAWKPVITSGKRLADVCKEALTVWLRKLEDERRQKAEAERREAERLRAEAEAAIRASSGNLAAREEAEAQLKEAKQADRAARKVEKAKPSAGTGEISRAVSLRTVHVVELTDVEAALNHYQTAAPEEFVRLLTTLAERDVRAGKRIIPGFNVREEKRAV